MNDDMTRLEAPKGSIRIRWTPERCPMCEQINTCARFESETTGAMQWFCYNLTPDVQ